jgi:hypothetical protein
VNLGSDGDIAWSLGISAAEIFLGLAWVLIILIFDDNVFYSVHTGWTRHMIRCFVVSVLSVSGFR